jgi:glutamyl-Q tRNA(Asp) synthetase
LVRIEDLDPPRTVPGSADRILRALEAFGFEWDGPVLYQSQRTEAYRDAAQHLHERGLAYPCSCSRTEIASRSPDAVRHTGENADEIRYPGWCRAGLLRPDRSPALRLVVKDGTVSFIDRAYGGISRNVAAESGDFVIRRRDGLFAYQLAVTLDDAAQGVTDVVRGADLLMSTCRQILLQQALSLPTPRYLHLPLAVDKSGVKLAKSTGAAALDLRYSSRFLWRALAFLQQSPPPELLCDSPAAAAAADDTQHLWSWALRHWNPQALLER